MPGTVTVACRLPHGLILQLCRMEDHDEPQFGGGYKTVRRAVVEPVSVKINGWARYKGQDSEHPITFGAGLTYGVDADFFAMWLVQHKDSDFVKKGLVFAQAKPGEIEAQAKAHRTLKSGFEPTDPQNLPDEFRGKVKTADVK